MQSVPLRTAGGLSTAHSVDARVRGSAQRCEGWAAHRGPLSSPGLMHLLNRGRDHIVYLKCVSPFHR